MHVYSSDALETGYDVKSSISPFGDRRYEIRYLRRLRFLSPAPMNLQSPNSIQLHLRTYIQLNLHLQFLFFFISSLNRNIQSNLKNKHVSFKSRFPMTKKVVCTQNVHTFTNIVHCSKLIHKRKTGFFENRFLNNVSLCHL